jgi:DNA polymerase III alpha subunit
VPRPTDEITFESFTSLSALAALTSRVRLGHIVICTAFRNPALTAKMISTMDSISGGRMDLGIGAGWKRDEWLAYGYGFPETRERLGLRSIPPGDAKTYKLLQAAQTIGCFQVESPAMMNLLRRMKPENIYELTQALALIRPGPTESGMKEALLRAREKRQAFRDPLLEKILPETGGLLLYEEQVMQVAERAAGMPPEEGDLLRRALKKKNGTRAALKEKFFREARERGYTAAEAEKLWTTMEKFSSYSFNKAHSASYAAMAYQAVYLKVHHTVPYLAAVLNAGGGYYMLTAYIEEAKRRGISFLGPDINRSGRLFEVEGPNIRVGLTSIKGLAQKTIEKIIAERKDGEFAWSKISWPASISEGPSPVLIKAGCSIP